MCLRCPYIDLTGSCVGLMMASVDLIALSRILGTSSMALSALEDAMSVHFIGEAKAGWRRMNLKAE